MAAQEELKTVKCETGNLLFARLDNRPSIENLEPILFDSLSAGSIIEILGESNSGKTELLYHFIARCIFPLSWKGLHLDGLDCGVIFIDNDFHFNLFRLVTILENRIISSVSTETSSLTNATISSFIKDRLKLLNIIKCSSSEQLITSLYSLQDFLGCDNVVGVLMVDSISTFYWVDRMNVMNQWKKVEEYYIKLASTVISLVQNYSLIVFTTKCATKGMEKGLYSDEKRDTDGLDDDYDFMGKQWQQLVTHRIALVWSSAQKESTCLTLHKTHLGKKETVNCMIADAGFRIL